MLKLKKLRQPHKFNKSWLWTGAKIALAVVLISLVLSQTSFSEVKALWHRVSVEWLLGSVLAFYAIVWLMARRYWLLTGRKTTFYEILGLVIVQTVVGNLVATTAGVASYIAILRGKHQIQISHSIASIILARFGDLLVLVIALVVSSSIVWSQITSIHWIVALLITVLGGLFVFILLLLIFREKIIRMIYWIFNKIRLDTSVAGKRILKLVSFIETQEMEKARPELGKFLWYSFFIYLCNLLFVYCSMRAFSIDIGVWSIAFISSMIQVMTLVPIQIFGGLGVFDMTYMYLYGLFGVVQAQAIPVVVGLRIVFYGINLTLLLYLPFERHFGHKN